jgi:phosphate transport system protein
MQNRFQEISAMPRIHFQQQLAELKDKLLAMAALSQQAVETSVDAYLLRDAKLCNYVRENETAINTAQRDVDEMAYELLAKEQPMAIDLRFILSVIKINADLERIGDQSMSIARRAEDLIDEPRINLPVDIEEMGEYATRMIRSAVQSLLEADAPLADSVRDMDDDIDNMNREAHRRLIEIMQHSPEASLQALNAVIIARNLERIADHATNIATDVIFWVRGADVRHQMTYVQ